jgi:hypothetical protein
VFGILATCCAIAPVAGAGKPAREFVPAEDIIIEGSCAFEVGAHVIANNEYGITFSNGATLVTGALKITVTNLSDPSKSVTLSIPGPGLFTSTSSGGLSIDAYGPWLSFYPDVLMYATGRSLFHVSPAGEFSLSQKGAQAPTFALYSGSQCDRRAESEPAKENPMKRKEDE